MTEEQLKCRKTLNLAMDLGSGYGGLYEAARNLLEHDNDTTRRMVDLTDPLLRQAVDLLERAKVMLLQSDGLDENQDWSWVPGG